MLGLLLNKKKEGREGCDSEAGLVEDLDYAGHVYVPTYHTYYVMCVHTCMYICNTSIFVCVYISMESVDLRYKS